MPEFQLTKLTEFNPAIIYTQGGESAPYEQKSVIDVLVSTVTQLSDLGEGYLYLQNEVLPKLNSQSLAEITANDLKTWMDNFHRKLAQQLSKLYQCPELAGQYTTQQVLSWHHTEKLRDILPFYLCGLNFKSKASFCQLAARQTQTSVQEISELLDVFEFIDTDPRCIIYPYQLPDVEKNRGHILYKSPVLYAKLSYAYNENILTHAQRQAVEKYIKICIPPHQIKSRMLAFYNELLDKWRETDPQNLDQIVELAAFAFSKQLDIHPYFNANKRTCSGLMNAILRSFNQPSILLYHHEEETKDIDESLVGKAVSSLPHDVAPLKALIRKRILDAKQNAPYQSEKDKLGFEKRLELIDLIKQAKQLAPQVDHDSQCQRFINNSYATTELEMLTKVIQKYRSYIATLKPTSAEKEQSIFAKGFLVSSAKIDENFKADVIRFFKEKICGDNWKAYSKNGLQLILNLTSNENAQELLTKIQSLDLCQAKTMKRSDTGNTVIFVDKFDVSKLRAAIAEMKSPDNEATKVQFQ